MGGYKGKHIIGRQNYRENGESTLTTFTVHLVLLLFTRIK